MIEQNLFPLGTLAITPAALDALAPAIASDLFARHAAGDWGDLSAEDRRENEYSIPRHLRIFSAYNVGEGQRVFVITEADRSVTTILLAEEY